MLLLLLLSLYQQAIFQSVTSMPAEMLVEVLYTMVTASSPFQSTELHLQTQVTKGREPGAEPSTQTCESLYLLVHLLEGYEIQCEAQQSNAK